ncbi:NAD(P)-binding protein [Coprinopsis marcescibilis]|uniref:NAD(P)-binding protein n=1 Tax=Coprinopsis marcescibilis TaxID=230819 RepID=A0A5C3L838_COPMA|nr:NAD(P)-binding protein [Coprinopsis marcescibilis]
MQPTFMDFIRLQRAGVPPLTTDDLTGKVVLVTGANTGIGYEIAKNFAQMNPAKVIIACRSKDKGRAAVAKLRQETGFDNIELRIVDFAKFSSVVEFSDAFVKEEKRLDILIANAAVAMEEYTTTSDGWETTIQVNVLSTLLSCIRLAPLMIETAKLSPGSKPRVVIVGSSIHYNIRTLEGKLFDSGNLLRNVSGPEYSKAKMAQRYTESKVLVVLMVQSLTQAFENTPVIVNSACPGYCYSELRRNIVGIKGLIFRIMDWFLAWTSEEGSRQIIWATLAGKENPDSMRGTFCSGMAVLETSDYTISSEGLKAQEMLWNNLIEELSRVDPNVSVILKDVQNKK